MRIKTQTVGQLVTTHRNLQSLECAKTLDFKTYLRYCGTGLLYIPLKQKKKKELIKL